MQLLSGLTDSVQWGNKYVTDSWSESYQVVGTSLNSNKKIWSSQYSSISPWGSQILTSVMLDLEWRNRMHELESTLSIKN